VILKKFRENLKKPKSGGFVEEEKKEPNISEPVYAIAKALKERPETFSASRCRWMSGRGVEVIDRITGVRFKGWATVSPTFNNHHTVIYTTRYDVITSFDLTKDEEQYLGVEFEAWLENKKRRVSRKQRNLVKRKYGCL